MGFRLPYVVVEGGLAGVGKAKVVTKPRHKRNARYGARVRQSMQVRGSGVMEPDSGDAICRVQVPF